MSNMIDHVDMIDDTTDTELAQDYTPWTDPKKEWRDRAINQLEGGLTINDLRETARASSLPARGSVMYRSLFEDALATCMAMLYLKDEQQYEAVARRLPKTEKGIGRLYDLIMQIVLQEDDGLDDWEQTVFETIKSRPHLYEDEFTMDVVNVYPGFIKMNRKLKWLIPNINRDEAKALAFGWLEGDTKAEPLNKPKTRHRENGDWILVFDRRWFTGLDSRIETVTITISAEAFVQHSIEDRDDGSWSNVELKRGRKPGFNVKKVIDKAFENMYVVEECEGPRLVQVL